MTTRGEQRLLILWGIAMLLGSILLLWVLYLIRNVLLAVYVSTLLAIGFSPAVRWLERQQYLGKRAGGLPRWAAILVLYGGFLAVFAILMSIVIPPLVVQATALFSQLPTYIDQLQGFLVRKKMLSPGTELIKELPSPSLAVTSVLGVVQSMFGALGAVVTIVLLPYYLLVDSEALHRGLVQLASKDQRPHLARITENVAVKVGAWLNGQILICVLIGGMTSLSLYLLGVPFFYVLGLIAGLGELVPIIGPLLAALPAILVAWTVSIKTALFVMAYFSVQQFLEGSVIVPRVMERQVGVSAVAVIVALLIGSELLGVVGALLAVPTAAIVLVLFQEYLKSEATQAGA